MCNDVCDPSQLDSSTYEERSSDHRFRQHRVRSKACWPKIAWISVVPLLGVTVVALLPSMCCTACWNGDGHRGCLFVGQNTWEGLVCDIYCNIE